MEKQYLPEVIKSTRITLKKHSKDLAQQMFEYVREGRLRQVMNINGAFRDLELFSKIKSDLK